ncbi:phage major capsid protein [Clostridiaceae bacterium OttesenSCG-928-D20]|nr:phage major capsid protein [Clostridiaceae bacterium OttesenSCG-928-D20]
MNFKYNEIKLDKGMYQESGKSFSQCLEKLDPSENYKGTSLEGLDAFQRQLKRFDIKPRGANSSSVEKFFRTSESSVLFPEYVSRSVKAGMEEENILPSITATVTKFDGLDYRSIYSVPTEDEKSLRKVEEGAAIPQTEVKARESLVRLHKRGRMLVASYEAIRFQRLDLFGVMLRQIGSQIMRMHLDDAIKVIKEGDGNENPAISYSSGDAVIGGTAGELTYDQLLAFWNEFDPYSMNTMLVSPDVMLKVLRCPEFQNPLTGLNFQGSGELSNPLGAKLIKTSALGTGTLIGLDRGYALEMVQSADVSVEYDRLIDRQLERAAITSISGFAKLYSEASKVLSLA